MGNATLHDVAARTGLSVSTVSHVLNGRAGFNPKTRQRVKEAARELAYQPNMLSRALLGGRSMSIGLVGVTLKTSVKLMRVRRVEALAKQDGYRLYLVANEGAVEEEEGLSVVADLTARRVDGLLVAHESPIPARVVEALLGCGKPAVFLGEVPEAAAWGARVDREPGIRQAMRHLARLGHRQVLYLGTQFDYTHPEQKLHTLQKVAGEERLELLADPQLVPEQSDVEGHTAPAYRLIRAMLERGHRPTAVMCINDESAIGAITAFQEARWGVPEDVSVVGFDDMPLASFMHPPLTTIHQPREEVGEVAYRMLQELFSDAPGRPRVVPFPCELIERRSTGPVRAEARP